VTQVPLTYERKTISLAAARIAAQAAAAVAERNGWTVSIAVADPHGGIVHLERMDGAGLPTMEMAQGKAFSSACTTVPTRLFEEALKAGKPEILVLRSITPLQGGLPIVIDGTVVGAIAVAGLSGEQNEQCAQAGVDALQAAVQSAEQ
jgi:glc operon protein GlcG